MTSTFRNGAFGAALVATTAFATIAAPGAARADHWHHHHGGGGTAAAVVGVGALGLLAGAAIADSNRPRDCYLQRRKFIDRRGYVHYRDIEVCED